MPLGGQQVASYHLLVQEKKNTIRLEASQSTAEDHRTQVITVRTPPHLVFVLAEVRKTLATAGYAVPGMPSGRRRYFFSIMKLRTSICIYARHGPIVYTQPFDAFCRWHHSRGVHLRHMCTSGKNQTNRGLRGP